VNGGRGGAAGVAAGWGRGRGRRGSPWVGGHRDGDDVAPNVGVGDGLARLALSWGIVGTGSRGGDGFDDRDGRGWGWAAASCLGGRGSRWSGSPGVDWLDGAGLVARGGGPDLGRDPGGVVS